MKKRKVANLCFQSPRQCGGIAVYIGNLPPVGRIDGTWRNRIICAAVHVVPPEHFGAGELGITPPCGIPNFFALDEVVGLTPEPDLSHIPEIPSICDDAMTTGHETGEK